MTLLYTFCLVINQNAQFMVVSWTTIVESLKINYNFTCLSFRRWFEIIYLIYTSHLNPSLSCWLTSRLYQFKWGGKMECSSAVNTNRCNYLYLLALKHFVYSDIKYSLLRGPIWFFYLWSLTGYCQQFWSFRLMFCRLLGMAMFYT